MFHKINTTLPEAQGRGTRLFTASQPQQTAPVVLPAFDSPRARMRGSLVTAVVDALTGPDSKTRPSHRCGEVSALVEQPGQPKQRRARPIPDFTSDGTRAALLCFRPSLSWDRTRATAQQYCVPQLKDESLGSRDMKCR